MFKRTHVLKCTATQRLAVEVIVVDVAILKAVGMVIAGVPFFAHRLGNRVTQLTAARPCTSERGPEGIRVHERCPRSVDY